MKRIIIIVFILFFVSLINAEALCICTDKEGTSIITDSPQDGMKCVSKGSDEAANIEGNQSQRKTKNSMKNQRYDSRIKVDETEGAVLDNRDWQRQRLREINERNRERKRQQAEEGQP